MKAGSRERVKAERREREKEKAEGRERESRKERKRKQKQRKRKQRKRKQKVEKAEIGERVKAESREREKAESRETESRKYRNRKYRKQQKVKREASTEMQCTLSRSLGEQESKSADLSVRKTSTDYVRTFCLCGSKQDEPLLSRKRGVVTAAVSRVADNKVKCHHPIPLSWLWTVINRPCLRPA